MSEKTQSRLNGWVVGYLSRSSTMHLMVLRDISTAPKDRWIFLFGGKTDEDLGYDDPTCTEEDMSRPVSARWDADKEAWVCGYWDSGWRTFYHNPKLWAYIKQDADVRKGVYV